MFLEHILLAGRIPGLTSNICVSFCLSVHVLVLIIFLDVANTRGYFISVL